MVGERVSSEIQYIARDSKHEFVDIERRYWTSQLGKWDLVIERSWDSIRFKTLSEIQYMVGERVSSHDMQIQYIEQIQYIHRADSIHGWWARELGDSIHSSRFKTRVRWHRAEILNESARQMGFGHRAELRLDSIQNTLGDSIHGWWARELTWHADSIHRADSIHT